MTPIFKEGERAILRCLHCPYDSGRPVVLVLAVHRALGAELSRFYSGAVLDCLGFSAGRDCSKCKEAAKMPTFLRTQGCWGEVSTCLRLYTGFWFRFVQVSEAS